MKLFDEQQRVHRRSLLDVTKMAIEMGRRNDAADMRGKLTCSLPFCSVGDAFAKSWQALFQFSAFSCIGNLSSVSLFPCLKQPAAQELRTKCKTLWCTLRVSL